MEEISGEERWKFKLNDDIESDEELVNRFIVELREIAVSFPGKTVLVVSHGGCIVNFLIKVGYGTRAQLPSASFANAAYVKMLSDGVDFFVKETNGVTLKQGTE